MQHAKYFDLIKSYSGNTCTVKQRPFLFQNKHYDFINKYIFF